MTLMLATVAHSQCQVSLGVEQIYRECFGFVWANLRRLGVPDACLEDAAHDVFVVVHRRAARYDPRRASLRTWVFGIVRRVAADHRRGHERRRRKLSALRSDPAWTASVDTGRSAETRAVLRRLLESVDEERATIFVLSQLYGIPMREIAAELGINPHTAASKLRAIRETFKALCAEQETEIALREVDDDQQVPPQARQRVLAGLVPIIGGSDLAASGLGIKSLWGGVASLAIAAAVTLGPLARADGGNATPPTGEQVGEAVVRQDDSPQGRAPDGPARPDDMPLEREMHDVARSSAASASARERPEPAKAVQTSQPSPTKRVRGPDPEPPPEPDTAEIDLVMAARRAVRDGQPQRALALAREHDDRFAAGPLRIEITLVAIEALCDVGRREAAIERARTLPPSVPDPFDDPGLLARCGQAH